MVKNRGSLYSPVNATSDEFRDCNGKSRSRCSCTTGSTCENGLCVILIASAADTAGDLVKMSEMNGPDTRGEVIEVM